VLICHHVLAAATATATATTAATTTTTTTTLFTINTERQKDRHAGRPKEQSEPYN